MKKIILDLGKAKNEEEAQNYIAETFGFGPKYGRNLDALYDELTSVSEPTAIGVFAPVGDMDGLDFDYLIYTDKLCETFADAEGDNPSLAVIFGDLPHNKGFEDAYDDIFDEDADFDDYTGERIGHKADFGDFDDDSDTEDFSDESDMPGDKDIVLLDIGGTK